MIDEGQAVDIRGLSEKSLVKQLRRLFISLNLKENGDKVFLLPHKASPTLEVVGPIIRFHLQAKKDIEHLDSLRVAHSTPPDSEKGHLTDNVDDTKEEPVGLRRRYTILCFIVSYTADSLHALYYFTVTSPCISCLTCGHG